MQRSPSKINTKKKSSLLIPSQGVLVIHTVKYIETVKSFIRWSKKGPLESSSKNEWAKIGGLQPFRGYKSF